MTGASSSSSSTNMNEIWRASYARSGSYASLSSTDRDARQSNSEVLRSRNNNNSLGTHATEDQHDNDEDDDESTERSGERSPFRRSFDSDEQMAATSVSSFHGGSDLPAAGGASTRSRGNSPARSLSAGADHPSAGSNLYAGGSFDLDDEDDDEDLEAELRRYHLDFCSTAGGDTLHSANGGSPTLAPRLSLAKYVWHSFQSVRQQARQRRAQLLLQQSERNCWQSFWVCIMTYCDATDGGIMLVASLMVTWSLLVWLVHDPAVRRWIASGGIVAFAVRVGTRPLCTYCRRQQQKRRLRLTMQQQLPQHYPISRLPQQQARRQPPPELSDAEESGKPSPYADRPRLNDDRSHLFGNDGSLELPAIGDTTGGWMKGIPSCAPAASNETPPGIQLSRSNGSDPAVAAI
jgi:hypothetical protein